MAYTEWADIPLALQGKFAKFLGASSETTTTIRDAQLLLFATQAQAMIDSALVDKYDVPWTHATVPNLIKTISLHFTIWLMSGAQQAKGEAYQAQYEAAKDILDKLAAGEMRLYSEVDGSILSPWSSDYGTLSNYSEDYDEIEEDYRIFPRTAMPPIPSTVDYYSREEDD